MERPVILNTHCSNNVGKGPSRIILNPYSNKLLCIKHTVLLSLRKSNRTFVMQRLTLLCQHPTQQMTSKPRQKNI